MLSYMVHVPRFTSSFIGTAGFLSLCDVALMVTHMMYFLVQFCLEGLLVLQHRKDYPGSIYSPSGTVLAIVTPCCLREALPS